VSCMVFWIKSTAEIPKIGPSVPEKGDLLNETDFIFLIGK
jgi:hypothetical protein